MLTAESGVVEEELGGSSWTERSRETGNSILVKKKYLVSCLERRTNAFGSFLFAFVFLVDLLRCGGGSHISLGFRDDSQERVWRVQRMARVE